MDATVNKLQQTCLQDSFSFVNMLCLFQIFHLYIGQSTRLILAKPLGDLWMVHVIRYKQAPAELEDDATRKY